MSNIVTGAPSSAWCAAYVRFQNEFKIASYLKERFDFETLVPCRRLLGSRNGKTTTLVRPLLDSYVFFRTAGANIDWRMLFSVNGVVDLVRQQGRVALIPDEEVTSLQAFYDSDEPIHEVEYKRFSPNERVEVVRGPLKGAIGFFVRSDGRTGQLVVNVELFQRAVQTMVEARFVRPY